MFTRVLAHYEHALPVLSAGLPVLVEKPMTATASDARALVAVAAENNAELMVPCGWNFREFSERAKELIAGGAVGRVEVLNFG